jgi:DNA-binding response OmpR family regulator
MLSPFPSARGTVLVVDDEADARALVSEYLERHGFDVDQASDGIDALSYLYATKPLALLIDLVMPRMNGVDVIRQIRTDRKLAGVPIIAMSGTSEMLARAKEAGAETGVPKPINLPLLLRTVRAQMARARRLASGSDVPDPRRRDVA